MQEYVIRYELEDGSVNTLLFPEAHKMYAFKVYNFLCFDESIVEVDFGKRIFPKPDYHAKHFRTKRGDSDACN